MVFGINVAGILVDKGELAPERGGLFCLARVLRHGRLIEAVHDIVHQGVVVNKGGHGRTSHHVREGGRGTTKPWCSEREDGRRFYMAFLILS